MILEIRYITKETAQTNYIYVSFPDRFVDSESIVNRISKKTWASMMLKVFDKNKYFGCFSAFNKEFADFLKKKFSIGNGSIEDICKNIFYGIKPYEVPLAVPFISK